MLCGSRRLLVTICAKGDACLDVGVNWKALRVGKPNSNVDEFEGMGD